MQDVDLGASQQPAIIIQLSVLFPIALLATGLRFLARRISKAGLWWDDWLILAATILNVAFTAVPNLVLSYGLGRHIEALPAGTINRFLMTYYVGQILYSCVLGTVKLSIIALYWRIFGLFDSIRGLLWGLFAVVMSWWLATLGGCIFACHPIEYAWGDMSQPGGSCIDEKMFFLVMGSIKSATDVCLLVFPICYVMSSQLRGCLKVLVCVVFLLGGLVCIITLVRIAALVHRDFTAVDQTWVETAFAEWTSVEVNMAITSACLPVLKPLLSYYGSKASSKVDRSRLSPLSSTIRRGSRGTIIGDSSRTPSCRLIREHSVWGHEGIAVEMQESWPDSENERRARLGAFEIWSRGTDDLDLEQLHLKA